MGYVLLIGGARSGKSKLAVHLGKEAGAPVTFVATASAGDDEMAVRIARHRENRPGDWRTVETQVDLLGAVTAGAPDDYLIVDCLTLWVSNLLGVGRAAADIEIEARAIAAELSVRTGVVVTNEVGLGIVPMNELSRTYRDVLGAVNALFAERAERSFFMAAGRAVELGSAEAVLKPR